MAGEGTAAVIEMLGNTVTNLQQQVEAAQRTIQAQQQQIEELKRAPEVQPNDHKVT